MSTRIIEGSLVLPADAPQVTCRRLVVELRDVSQLDAPSVVVAQQEFERVALEPNGRLRFQFEAPEVEETHTLSLRAHASLSGGERVQPGDLLTTSSCEIASRGPQPEVTVSLKRV